MLMHGEDEWRCAFRPIMLSEPTISRSCRRRHCRHHHRHCRRRRRHHITVEILLCNMYMYRLQLLYIDR